MSINIELVCKEPGRSNGDESVYPSKQRSGYWIHVHTVDGRGQTDAAKLRVNRRPLEEPYVPTVMEPPSA